MGQDADASMQREGLKSKCQLRQLSMLARGGWKKLKLGSRERTKGTQKEAITFHRAHKEWSAHLPVHCLVPQGLPPTQSKKKRLQHPERHLPRTCPTFWAPGCWTLRWPLPLDCERGSDCSSECHPPPPRPVRPGWGCPHSQPLEEAGRAELLCKRECGGRGAHRSDRERQWHSWCPGDSRRPAWGRRGNTISRPASARTTEPTRCSGAHQQASQPARKVTQAASRPTSQRARHQVRGKLGRQNMVPAYQELQWRRESVIQGSHEKPFSYSCDRARRWSAQRRTQARGTMWQTRQRSRPQGSGGETHLFYQQLLCWGICCCPHGAYLLGGDRQTDCSPMVTALGRKVWQVWGRDSLEELGCDFGHRGSLSER